MNAVGGFSMLVCESFFSVLIFALLSLVVKLFIKSIFLPEKNQFRLFPFKTKFQRNEFWKFLLRRDFQHKKTLWFFSELQFSMEYRGSHDFLIVLLATAVQHHFSTKRQHRYSTLDRVQLAITVSHINKNNANLFQSPSLTKGGEKRDLITLIRWVCAKVFRLFYFDFDPNPRRRRVVLFCHEWWIKVRKMRAFRVSTHASLQKKVE